MKYDHKKIEKKWQKKWLQEKVFSVGDGFASGGAKQKFYQLETFPYPSAAGLHVGHPKGYIAEDIHARFMRMQGREVLYTMGWDAFGLPTENYAIKVGKAPQEVAKANIKNFKRQVQMFGLSYDWDREINTSSPDYYRWTQWLFIKLWEKGLAYRAKAKVNWCPKDLTVLANEQVILKVLKNDPEQQRRVTEKSKPQNAVGVCERCETPIIQKEMDQWFLKITDYAEQLLNDLKGLDWPAATVKRQEDWIGKSEGAEIDFSLVFKKDIGKKPNYLILHGYTGRNDKNFIPWLKNKLEKQESVVQAPQLPNTDNPKESEQVNFVIENCKIDESTILVGHSLGGVVAMKVLQKINRPIAGLVLIAPAIDPSFPTDLDKEERPYWKEFTWDFAYERITELTGFRIVLSDLKEKKRIHYLKDLALKLSAKLVAGMAYREHFCGEEEPIILKNLLSHLTVFTTRPDTLFGATYLVLAPEHPWVTLATDDNHDVLFNKEEVKKYVLATSQKTELIRQEQTKEKTGVELKGVKAINPATKEEIPIWIADYVLGSYGTGAIMAVPAHDERDFEFAKKFKLPIRSVVIPKEQYDGSAAMIETERKTFLFQKRSNDAPTRPGMIGLFGGAREERENSFETLKRELREELDLDILKYPFRFIDAVERTSVKNHYFAIFHVQNVTKKDTILHEGEAIVELTLEDALKNKEVTDYAKNIIKAFQRSQKIFISHGLLIDSDKFSGMDSEKAKWEITEFVGGQRKIQYRLRDWSVSRQRYWGVPIPIIYCRKCWEIAKSKSQIANLRYGIDYTKINGEEVVMHGVPEKDLPVELPKLKDYRPKGVPPLASSKKFMSVECPKCGGKARRDSETLDTFVDSSWYYLRYTDPHNASQFANSDLLNYWLPVDLYVIGAEHTVLHLLYSRFITKFLKDEGFVDFSEPFLKIRHVGLIQGSDGQKMSKSRGNVVNPDEIVGEFGADAARLYEMFMGPFEDGQPWDPRGVIGTERFLKRFWVYVIERIKNGAEEKTSSEGARLIQKTIKKIGEDIPAFKFNTAISALMILLNELEGKSIEKKDIETLVKLMHPFAPHMAQELWSQLGHDTFLDFEPWPTYDEKLITNETIQLVIQVNGKTRDIVSASSSITEVEAKKLAEASEKAKPFITGSPKKIIFVPGRLINLVI